MAYQRQYRNSLQARKHVIARDQVSLLGNGVMKITLLALVGRGLIKILFANVPANYRLG